MDVGDTVRLRFGPFMATGNVIKVTPIGVVVSINNDATLVGFRQAITTLEGAVLTQDQRHTFIGRAHWPTIEII